ncbi:MAG: PKD domain-containing protein, partial [Planctomycetes bacterium]|nr:PKD domain-containing protein [Planctomycetota bacterium]
MAIVKHDGTPLSFRTPLCALVASALALAGACNTVTAPPDDSGGIAIADAVRVVGVADDTNPRTWQFAIESDAALPDGLRVEWNFGAERSILGLTPTFTFPTTGTYVVTAVGTDADGNILFTVTVDVKVVDESDVFTTASTGPVADAGPDQQVTAGSLVTLSGSGSLGDGGGVLTFDWQQLSGQAVALSNAAAPVATFVAPNVSGAAVVL